MLEPTSPAQAAQLYRQRRMGVVILLLPQPDLETDTFLQKDVILSSPERGRQVRSLMSVWVARWGLPSPGCSTLGGVAVPCVGLQEAEGRVMMSSAIPDSRLH